MIFKTWRLWVPVLILIAGAFALKLYKEDIVKDTIKEIEVETLKQNEVVRERTKNAVEENRKSNPTADPSVALDRLRQRQSSN